LGLANKNPLPKVVCFHQNEALLFLYVAFTYEGFRASYLLVRFYSCAISAPQIQMHVLLF
jgi:hypothetical protein